MNSSNVLSSLRLHNPFQNVSQVHSSPVDFNKMLLFNNGSSSVPFASVPRQSPSPECPNVGQMGRRVMGLKWQKQNKKLIGQCLLKNQQKLRSENLKQKKPMMERKRRARINACFDQLKEVLLHSDMQQNSKLEKADILEKTVTFVRLLQQQNVHLQQQNARLHQQLQQLLHCSEPTAIALRDGVQKGISLSVMATIDLFSGFPFFTPELCHRLKEEVPKKVATVAADIFSPTTTPTLALNSVIQQQQNSALMPSSKASTLAPSPVRFVFTSAPSSVPSSSVPFPMVRPPLTLPNCLWPFMNFQAFGWTAEAEGQKQKSEEKKHCGEEEEKGQKVRGERKADQSAGRTDRRVEASETEPGTPDTPGEEVEVDVESVEKTSDETQREGAKEEQDSGVFSENSEALNSRKKKLTEDPAKAKIGRKRRKRMDGSIWTVESVLDREEE
ncbi:hypothetical protein niasHT_015306 [Heterodera trifolii]|uniref:BHLH domain-containing protein n=1 Tax=Heterodera trifolii TaxID=157864 RepID=A0ABD2L1I1_9BILA